ncbi:MAG: tRNA-dihydrouridine synthase family protein [Candidatus ainarchaeum sp.]|nr:tRNA-dihydrouridine synthase family protein [Candidatus ainarchaeum sp.]
MQFKIGSLALKNQLVLAPMYRISDLPFRLLCRAQGAGLCFSEMINCEALIRNNKSNWCLAETIAEDFPLGMQLFGARIESMRKAAELLIEKKRFELLDLNLGCPSHNVLNQGAGAALLKRPERISEIISSWKDLGKPVTAKIRIAPNVLHSIKIAKTIERAGASALIVHGRTIQQENSGKIDFVAIKRIKKSLGIPVIGHGGIRGNAGFELMLEKTKCDAVMIGTAAIGNPGVFAEILGEKQIGRKEALAKYLELCNSLNFTLFGHVKQQVLRFLAGKENRELALRITKAKNLAELKECFK